MAKVSAKRQITLPIGQCHMLGIEPGDELESFVAGGRMTLVKKAKGAAKGLLKDVEANHSLSDEESLQSTLS